MVLISSCSSLSGYLAQLRLGVKPTLVYRPESQEKSVKVSLEGEVSGDNDSSSSLHGKFPLKFDSYWSQLRSTLDCTATPQVAIVTPTSLLLLLLYLVSIILNLLVCALIRSASFTLFELKLTFPDFYRLFHEGQILVIDLLEKGHSVGVGKTRETSGIVHFSLKKSNFSGIA